jgi:UDP-N-acetylglucosamine 2-epimerase (non-hydrolysing)
MTILHVVGARPNFMKAAPVLRALSEVSSARQILVHTGQHYDVNMSEVFFQELDLPSPDVNLGVGSGSHTQQTSQIMAAFEPVVLEHKPSVVIVYGDVNSTMATALVCSKLRVPVAHVEAGLRSFDRTMPEEINRLVTDQLADLLFTPSEDANGNLEREGIAHEKVHLVGNVMIDTLIRMLPKAEQSRSNSLPERYVLVTLHRPSNVDDLNWLTVLLQLLGDISHDLPVLFPVHPRTRQKMSEAGIHLDAASNVHLLEPAPYLQFLALQKHASLVVTDSGGVQEETTFLRVPCLTVRENTERPVTTALGTNILVGRDLNLLRAEVKQILAGNRKPGVIPPLWDGCAGRRIAQIITGSQLQLAQAPAPCGAELNRVGAYAAAMEKRR